MEEVSRAFLYATQSKAAYIEPPYIPPYEPPHDEESDRNETVQPTPVPKPTSAPKPDEPSIMVSAVAVNYNQSGDVVGRNTWTKEDITELGRGGIWISPNILSEAGEREYGGRE